MARETSLWRWLSKARGKLQDGLHMNRVENSISSGMPDVEGCLSAAGIQGGMQFWIELKSVPRPRHPDTKLPIKLRDSQVEWARRRIEAGGRSWILVQVGSGHTAQRYLLYGTDAPALKNGLTEAQVRNRCEMRKYTCFDLDAPEDFIRRAANIFTWKGLRAYYG